MSSHGSIGEGNLEIWKSGNLGICLRSPYLHISTFPHFHIFQFAMLLFLAASGLAAAPKPDLLAAARRFYNERRYDQALETATLAAKTPATASSAHLIMGRARLERYRQTQTP